MPLHTDGQGNVTYRPPITNTSQAYGPAAAVAPQPYGAPGGFDLYTQAPTLGYPSSYYDMFNNQTAPVAPAGPDLLDKYRRFLYEGGINPDTIGGATINRQTGKMEVPRLAQQNAAVSAKDMAAAQDSRLRNAAYAMQKRDPGGAAALLNLASQQGAQYGPSYESKINFWQRVLQNAGLNRANGYF